MFIFNPNYNLNNIEETSSDVENNFELNKKHNYSSNEEISELAEENEKLKLENSKLKKEKELLAYFKKTYEFKIEKLEEIIKEDEIKIKKLIDELNFFVDGYYAVAKERNEKSLILKKRKKDYEKVRMIKEKEILNLTKLLEEKYEEIEKLKRKEEYY